MRNLPLALGCDLCNYLPVEAARYCRVENTMPSRNCIVCGVQINGHGGRKACSSCRYKERRSPEFKARAVVHQKVNRSIIFGRLVRLPCEVCGAVKTDAHHDDYSKPLSVRWLCRKHHIALHRAA